MVSETGSYVSNIELIMFGPGYTRTILQFVLVIHEVTSRRNTSECFV